MKQRDEALAANIAQRFGSVLTAVETGCAQLSYEVPRESLKETLTALRDEPDFLFTELVDLAGVDFLGYGAGEWQTLSATGTGFSRGVEREVTVPEADATFEPTRFAVVYNLLSMEHNTRLRLRVYTGVSNPPAVPTVTDIWASANWYEREAFDLFGIVFEGHPDLRRLLTDYGFIGHPFRKDFPLSGNVEVRYDEEQKRVIYQPVSIEPRVGVPRVVRDDHRYEPGLKGDEHG